MYHSYSDILGRHAVSVIKSMTGHKPTSLRILPVNVNDTFSFALGVKVDFKGLDDNGRVWEGFFICAFDSFDSARIISQKIAQHFGLDPAMADNHDGVSNVVSEFLNIVIGLTCSDWADHGLRIDFTPPEKLSENLSRSVPSGVKAFHLILDAEDYSGLSIFLNFLPASFA